MNLAESFVYHPVGNGIDEFHKYLYSHPKCHHFAQSEWNVIWRMMRLSEEFHQGEVRNISGFPYITHPIEIVEEEIHEQAHPKWKSIAILLGHDTLESHPERFREVFDIVPLDIFCRILKLSKLSRASREVIQDFLFYHLANLSSEMQEQYVYILAMLTHNPKRKKEIIKLLPEHDRGSFDALIEGYSPYLDKNCPDLSQEKKDIEIDGLWHYLFFDRDDARHKFRDTMHNLSDIHEMTPEQQNSYKLRRIPKLRALMFVLNRFGMMSKRDKLKQKWQEIGGKIDHLGYVVLHDQSHQLMSNISSQIGGIIST